MAEGRFSSASVGTFYAGLVALIAIALVMCALMVARTIAREDLRQQHQQDTHRGLEQVGALLSQVLDAETGQRGYLLTGERRYLEPYESGIVAVQTTLADLKEWAGRGEGRAEPIARIEALIAEKMAELTETLDRFQDGDREAALAIVRTDAGRSAMDRLRDEVAALREAEVAALAADLQVSRGNRRRTGALLTLTFIAAVLAVGLAAVMTRRAARAEARAQYLDAVSAERDRADLVSRELSHRVKNLFAVIMSIITTTARTEPDGREAARKTRERVQALARAHALTSGQRELRQAHLRELVEAVAAPYVPGGRTLQAEGPDVILPSSAVTPLGLILNELSTNAVKYGGWSVPGGTVAIRWAFCSEPGPSGDGAKGRILELKWTERGIDRGGGEPSRRGFGTTMVDLSAEQANASVSRKWMDDGVEITLRVGVPP